MTSLTYALAAVYAVISMFSFFGVIESSPMVQGAALAALAVSFYVIARKES